MFIMRRWRPLGNEEVNGRCWTVVLNMDGGKRCGERCHREFTAAVFDDGRRRDREHGAAHERGRSTLDRESQSVSSNFLLHRLRRDVSLQMKKKIESSMRKRTRTRKRDKNSRNPQERTEKVSQNHSHLRSSSKGKEALHKPCKPIVRDTSGWSLLQLMPKAGASCVMNFLAIDVGQAHKQRVGNCHGESEESIRT